MIIIKRLKVLFLMFVLSGMFIPVANAVEINSASNKYIFSNNVTADEKVRGDFAAVGETVKLEKGVGGDIAAAGKNVIIIDNDKVQNILAVGQFVSINVKEAANIYTAGGDVTVNADFSVNGAYIAGENVTFGGFAEDVYAAGNSVFVDGEISGNLVVRSDDITFSDKLKVGGEVEIYGAVMPELPSSIDESKVTFHLVEQKDYKEAGRRAFVISTVLSFLTAIVFALLLTLFLDRFIKTKANEFIKRAGLTVLFGLIAFIAIPVGAIIVMFTIICIPLSIIVLIFYGIILYLAPVITGMILGRLLLKNVNCYLSAVAGAVIIKLLLFVPYLKVILFLACAFYVLGSIVTSLRPDKKEPEINLDKPSEDNPPELPGQI